jgi:DHA1 family tetracycline resistance protein-like MFS transporter
VGIKAKTSQLVLFLVVFIDLIGFGIVIPMLPLYARSFQASASEVGALMFVYSLFQMLISPMWGILSDRWGRKPVLILTMAGQALCYAWAGFSHSYFDLLLTRACAGLFAGNISTANAFMADISTPEQRVKGMGLMGAAFGLGFVLGPAFGGLMMTIGNSIPFFAAGTLCALNLIVAAVVLQDTSTAESRELNRRRLNWLQVFKSVLSRKLGFLVLSSFAMTLALTQLEVTFSLFAVDRFLLDPHKALYLLAFMGIVMAIVQGGFVGRLNKKYREIRMAITGVVFVVLGLATLVFSYGVILGAIALAVMAVGYSLANPCLMAMVSKASAADSHGTAFGLYQSSSSLARIIGPILAGYLYDIRIEFPFVSGILLVMISGFLLTFEMFKQEAVS